MTGPEHYAKAESLVDQARVRRGPKFHGPHPPLDYKTPEQMIASAQVHATLALAAALGSSHQEGADDPAGT